MTATLSPNDLNFVLSRVPRDVRRLAVDGPIFIAGGFIRATIAGEKASDVDLFGPSKEALELLALKLATSRSGRHFGTDNAFTVLTGGRLPVQFIHRWTYPHGAEGAFRLLSEFDFTIAQAVLWFEPSAEKLAEGNEKEFNGKWHSLISERFYADLAARRLVYTHPQRTEDAGGSLLRVRKFLARGYTIQAMALSGVIARVCMKVRWHDIKDGDEEHATRVIAGLLREVDPMVVIDGVDLADEHEAA